MQFLYKSFYKDAKLIFCRSEHVPEEKKKKNCKRGFAFFRGSSKEPLGEAAIPQCLVEVSESQAFIFESVFLAAIVAAPK